LIARETRKTVLHDLPIGMRSVCLARSTAFALGCLMSVGLAGCGDDAPRSGERRDAGHDGAGAHRIDWLDVSAPISPAQWLASRGEDKPRSIGDPEVQRIAARLSEAHARYRENERMIANRSVQVSEMLRQIGISETAVRILDDLTGIVKLGQTEGFGAISQHYFNLRATGVAHSEAIATLKARYGSKS
jgi:hypothetical protein